MAHQHLYAGFSFHIRQHIRLGVVVWSIPAADHQAVPTKVSIHHQPGLRVIQRQTKSVKIFQAHFVIANSYKGGQLPGGNLHKFDCPAVTLAVTVYQIAGHQQHIRQREHRQQIMVISVVQIADHQ